VRPASFAARKRRSPATISYLSAEAERPHDDRLQDADLADARGEILERLLVEARAAHFLDVGLGRLDRAQRQRDLGRLAGGSVHCGLPSF
jgi:hypothetical protein